MKQPAPKTDSDRVVVMAMAFMEAMRERAKSDAALIKSLADKVLLNSGDLQIERIRLETVGEPIARATNAYTTTLAQMNGQHEPPDVEIPGRA